MYMLEASLYFVISQGEDNDPSSMMASVFFVLLLRLRDDSDPSPTTFFCGTIVLLECGSRLSRLSCRAPLPTLGFPVTVGRFYAAL